jgi:CheY-like chemotaxis protein
MVLLYDATVTNSAHWASSAPVWVEAVVVSDLPTFDDMIGRAHVVVVFIPDEWERDRQLIGRLKVLRATHPLKSVIVVRPSHDATSLPILADVTLHVQQTQQILWPTVRNLEDRWLSYRLADIVRGSKSGPPILRLAVIHALLRPTPVSSIKELAAEMGCDRRTLPRAWDIAFGTSAVRLMDFLDWVVLLYAIGRKSHKRPWVLVARDVGLAEETLARSARKLIGLSLSELARCGQPGVVPKFRVIFERLFGRWPEELALDVPVERLRHRIFVVDDHEAILQFLDHSLRRAGFDVVTAMNGIEALARISREQTLPTVVLTDVKMAGMDGMELARRIAQQWPSIRVILMSAFVSPDVAQRGWQRGYIDNPIKFLAKPFTAGRIMALLREACEKIA